MSSGASKHVRFPYKLAAKELKKNDEQWHAYNSTGDFIVLAGPGSGKTKVLTTKLARLLNEDVKSPHGLACVTYSGECARELKRRLATLGVRPSRRVFVGTVHSFCFKNVVIPFAHLAGLQISNPIRVATESEHGACFSDAVAATISVGENPGRWSIRCSNYRRRFLDRGHRSWRESDAQAAQVIEDYERRLRGRGLIDFDDMMLLGLQLIEQHSCLPALVVDSADRLQQGSLEIVASRSVAKAPCRRSEMP
jgi:superfamily I DNA/RNA helicase